MASLGESARRRQRVLIVGTGAPGGIGRVEQTLSEAALSKRAEHPVEFRALWRRRHPDYLRCGAIERMPTAGADPVGGGNVEYVRQLTRVICTMRPDFVLYTHVNLARPAPWMRRVGHPPYGVWVYGIDIWDRLSPLHRLGLRRSEVILTISRSSAERTVESQGVPRRLMRTIPLTLPEAMFTSRRDGAAREPGRVLTVARLAKTEKRKGVEDLVRAFAHLRRGQRDTTLVVVGDGDDRERLQTFAAGFGIADHVKFLGNISDTELTRQYERADIFVLPSDKEGFGLVFLEAMLSGTPVLGIASGGPLDLVRDGVDGRLITQLDQLTSVLQLMLSDRGRLEAMRQNAADRARRDFSPESFRRELFHSLHM